MPPVSSSASSGPVVLDASAVLALLFEEPGAEVVRAQLRTGVIGAANLAEVLAKLSDHGLPAMEAVRAVTILGLEVAPMTAAQAGRSAELRFLTRSVGPDCRPNLGCRGRGSGRQRPGDPVRMPPC